MRTIYKLIVLAAFAVCVGFSVKADVSPFFDAEKIHVPRSTEQRVGQRAVLAQGAVELQKAELGKVTQKIDKKRTPVRRAGEITAFTNPVIQINYSAGGVFNATHETQITLGESTIEIKNFNAMGETIKGTLNRATGEVEFPVQTAFNSDNYGRCVLASLTDDLKKFDTTATVKGEIANGVLTLRKWCVLITTGDFKNYTFGMVESAKFVSANAKMNSASLDTTNAVMNVSQSVYAEQTADNEITIFNAAGLSCMLRVQMKSDKTLAMRPQVLFTFNNKYFYNYKADYAAGLIYKRDQIVGTTEGNKLSWGNWIICNAAGEWAFRAKSTEIQLPFDIKYPAAQTQTGWKGSGTADDPWLIETPADLLALSDSVNYVSGVQVSARCYKAFEGKYFKQTKAINLSGINFPPIGGFDEMYRFAGHYDGGNKTISNLYVNSGKAGDAALFGAVDTVASIKNVKMTNPKVIDEYMYAGTVAAYCQGTLENITVTNGDVTSIHCAGGVAGCSGPASNVSFTGNVKGESQIGGVFGVLRWPGKNLVATNTTVTGTSKQETASVGGVVGFLGHECGGKLTDSYFSGDVVPTYNGQYAGLVAGVSSEGIFERCFGIGTIHQPTNGVSASGLGGVVKGTDAFTVKDGNTLWMDAAPVLTDTLVATYNGFVKRIPVAAVPDTVPLPTIAYNPHDNKITFADEMEGVTYYYTLDGTEPSVETSASTTEPVSAPAATTITVKVIAGKHNYYASAVAEAEFATTGVTDLGVGKTVASQTYVTPSGIVSATPVAGVNVVVTVYTDGTRAVTKKVFKVK